MAELRIEDYKFLPVEEAVAPRGGLYFQHYVDAWWLVHPDKGLLFYRRGLGGLGSPQCNTDERVTRMLFAKDPPPIDGIEVRKLASVWVPIDPCDYA